MMMVMVTGYNLLDRILSFELKGLREPAQEEPPVVTCLVTTQQLRRLEQQHGRA